ncbi:YiaA/YiaB family inner membrane protein [Bradyrhizobium prioriisuperbiae]|uniref:YiaA/YiaB family inner membrane protein n=1 Tax=Bradyrhizobium prioriisuperbiae TaxID=2854389 RepID=UPI0028E4790E|nr:YiaA/YiaB family inner membrane protein [Bradyrhizobium prioritasuperba]
MSIDQITPIDRPSSAWVNFSYVSFAGSILMVGGGIAALPLDWWVRGYFAIGMVMLVQSCFTLAKSLRDMHESGRMIHRIEEARTERLLRAEQ